MTTPQDEINLMRNLIAEFYDGSISNADQDKLIALFCKADLRFLPKDLAEEAEMFIMLGRAANDYGDVDFCNLEARIRAVTIDKEVKPKHKFEFGVWIRPIAAAAIIAAIFTSINFMENSPVDLESEPLSIIMVRLADQTDEDVEPFTDMLTEKAISPATGLSGMIASPTVVNMENEVDNYIEITNYDQATILTQDAMSLVRAKLAVAGFSIESASDGLRQIDTTIRDIIAN